MKKYADKNTLQYYVTKIKSLLAKKADIGHNHSKNDIENFPTSMPASDVYSWAKQMNKPTYSWSEISGRPSTMEPTSHTHDDRYYTENEINSKLNGKANSTHGHTSAAIEISQSTIDAYKSMGMI